MLCETEGGLNNIERGLNNSLNTPTGKVFKAMTLDIRVVGGKNEKNPIKFKELKM